MARIVNPPYATGPVNEGEARVINFLKDKLGDDYCLIPNIEFADTAQSRFLEVDLILIAPHCVYIIEIKDWGKTIEGNDQEWYLNGDRPRKNPHRTLNYKCRVIKSLLTKKAPDMEKVWFQSTVAIARSDTQLDLYGSCAGCTFALTDDLVEFLSSADTVDRKDNEIKHLQKEIESILLKDGKFKENKDIIIADHKVEEVLSQDQDLVEYLARPVHAKFGRLKRLRVFNLPIYQDDESKRKREEEIHRDYEVLELIGHHPNIVALKGFYNHESDQVVEILDWAEEGTLRIVMDKDNLTLEQKIAIIRDIANGLKAAHSKNIIHRNLKPENILIGNSGAQLMNFDKAYMSKKGGLTVWKTALAQEDRRYIAPELSGTSQTADVFFSTDIFSMGLIFYELIVGKLPYEAIERFLLDGGILKKEIMPSHIIPGVPAWIDKVIKKMIVGDVDERYASIEEFLKEFEYYISTPTEELLSKVPSKQEKSEEELFDDPNRVFKAGEKIGVFRVASEIVGKGGFAQVYKVTHTIQDQEFALKVYNSSVPLSSLIDEFKALQTLNHPNIVKFIWSDQLPGGRFYIVTEFLKGEPLSQYAWGTKKLTVQEALQVGRDIASALIYMHKDEPSKKAIYHRDIKPNNIMRVQDRGFVLIDFNIAKEADKSNTYAGTDSYIAPDLKYGNTINWDASGDTFALGVTLFELICKKHPYPNKDPRINIKPYYPKDIEGCESLSNEIADFLFKAVQPRKEDRFLTAESMHDGLIRVLENKKFYEVVEVATPVSTKTEDNNKMNYNPFVAKLRTLFSQSSISNAGTRGLDEVAKSTYIMTKLDKYLVPAILNGEYKLVIITGNAGDGKTALIQQLEAKGDNVQILPSKNGSKFTIKGIPFESNYDGSQDEGSVKNDEVLGRFLSPFAYKRNFHDVEEGRILAINEGRLIEFLSQPENKDKFGYLAEQIYEYFEKHGDIELPDGMLLINLNWRSVVAEGTESIFSRQLKEFVKPCQWEACKKCEYGDKCFIHYNAQTFADVSAGEEIIKRLQLIMEAVHLRRQLHITMRDVRSFLSYLICRDKSCEDIPKLLSGQAQDYLQYYYFNITDGNIKDSGNSDRLVKLVRSIDVGKVPHPNLDRDIHFLSVKDIELLGFTDRKEDYSQQILLNLLKNIENNLVSDQPDLRSRIVDYHRIARRKLYYEGRDDRTKNRLPYDEIDYFRSLLNEGAELDKIKTLLSRAISLSEGCKNQELNTQNICLMASNSKDPRCYAFRLFPMDDFEITITKLKGLSGFLEHSPDSFVLRHKIYNNVELEVTLDLFELLSHINKGFNPSLNDVKGRFIELIIFKNALLHLPYRKVLITEDHLNFYRIEADESNKLLLSKV